MLAQDMLLSNMDEVIINTCKLVRPEVTTGDLDTSLNLKRQGLYDGKYELINNVYYAYLWLAIQAKPEIINESLVKRLAEKVTGIVPDKSSMSLYGYEVSDVDMEDDGIINVASQVLRRVTQANQFNVYTPMVAVFVSGTILVTRNVGYLSVANKYTPDMDASIYIRENFGGKVC